MSRRKTTKVPEHDLYGCCIHWLMAQRWLQLEDGMSDHAPGEYPPEEAYLPARDERASNPAFYPEADDYARKHIIPRLTSLPTDEDAPTRRIDHIKRHGKAATDCPGPDHLAGVPPIPVP